MEAEQREDLIALIQSVRDGEPIQVDSSVALRMIAMRASEGVREIPETPETEPTRTVLFDILEIIGRASVTDVVGDGPGPWGDVDDFCGR